MLAGVITAGPQPAQVLDLLTSLGALIVWTTHADREFLENRRGRHDSIPVPLSRWAGDHSINGPYLCDAPGVRITL